MVIYQRERGDTRWQHRKTSFDTDNVLLSMVSEVLKKYHYTVSISEKRPSFYAGQATKNCLIFCVRISL